MISKIAVAGAGTMGSGIALCCAQNEFGVVLYDTGSEVLKKAQAGISKILDGLLAKGKLSSSEYESIAGRIRYSNDINECKADLIIEAIIEKAEAKIGLFNSLADINGADTIFASNTSSLSINQLQSSFRYPQRMAGLHFFNPANIMKLVEIVKGRHTDSAVLDSLQSFCIRLQKTAVVCKDAPGFIVNRVARHYYLESMNILENRGASIEQIDKIMEATGFKMGPFKLMDLIGNDINLAVTESLYQAFDKAHRFRPSPIQEAKVAAGELGRKTQKGFYDYNKG
jgi:3-hydroxybutyryl-CoA dehydrogenase